MRHGRTELTTGGESLLYTPDPLDRICLGNDDEDIGDGAASTMILVDTIFQAKSDRRPSASEDDRPFKPLDLFSRCRSVRAVVSATTSRMGCLCRYYNVVELKPV